MLQRVFYILVPVLLVLTLIMYCSFKLGADAHKYKTHVNQYSYIISGVYLKGLAPAFCISFTFSILTLLIAVVCFHAFRASSGPAGLNDGPPKWFAELWKRRRLDMGLRLGI